MTSSSLVKIRRSPWAIEAESGFRARPCWMTLSVVAAGTATTKPSKMAMARTRRLDIMAPLHFRTPSELHGGPQADVDIVVAAGVHGAAVEPEIVHVLHGQADVHVRERRVRFSPWHVSDFQDHALRIRAAVRRAPVVDVGGADRAKVLQRWCNRRSEAVGDVDAHRVEPVLVEGADRERIAWSHRSRLVNVGRVG